MILLLLILLLLFGGLGVSPINTYGIAGYSPAAIVIVIIFLVLLLR